LSAEAHRAKAEAKPLEFAREGLFSEPHFDDRHGDKSCPILPRSKKNPATIPIPYALFAAHHSLFHPRPLHRPYHPSHRSCGNRVRTGDQGERRLPPPSGIPVPEGLRARDRPEPCAAPVGPKPETATGGWRDAQGAENPRRFGSGVCVTGLGARKGKRSLPCPVDVGTAAGGARCSRHTNYTERHGQRAPLPIPNQRPDGENRAWRR
jgi:hypothetical protein